MSNRAILYQGAATVGAWAWGKFGERVVERLSRAVGEKLQAKVVGRWSRVGWRKASEKYRKKVQKLHGHHSSAG